MPASIRFRLKTRHLITLLLLGTVLLIQNVQSIPLSSQSLIKAPNSTSNASAGSLSAYSLNETTSLSQSTTTLTAAINESSKPLQYANWTQNMIHVQAPGIGCFAASYPTTTWQSAQCATAPSVRLASQQVGNGNDEVARSSGPIIGSSVGSFLSTSGLTSETDSVNGTNYYSLQDNSQFFTTSTTYTGGKSAQGWEQFVFVNDPGLSEGFAFIQYWLINYKTTYGSCPGTPPPGEYSTPWTEYQGSCYANSGAAITQLAQASKLLQQSLAGYANIPGSNDEVTFCLVSGTCYSVSITEQVLNLYQHWQDSEFNIFGFGNGSQANFNSGTTITVLNTLKDQSGNIITPSCVNTGYTAETNNLNLGTCSSNNNGQIDFTETNLVVNQVNFFTNPSSGGSIQVQSPSGTINVGGTDSRNSESNIILSAQFSASAPLIVTQLGIYVYSYSSGAAATLGLYTDNGGGPLLFPQL